VDEEQAMATDLDELWLKEWADEVVADLETYLEKRPAIHDVPDDQADL
jgi:hypothetical protein